MGNLVPSDFTQAASRLLREANGGFVMLSDGEHEVGALVPAEYMARVRRLAWKRMDEISRQASTNVESHATELGIPVEALVEQLLADGDE